MKKSRGRASAVFRYTLRARRGATRRDTTRFLSTVLFTVDRIVVVDKQIYHSYILMYKRNLYRVQTLLFRVDFIQRKMFFFFFFYHRPVSDQKFVEIPETTNLLRALFV